MINTDVLTTDIIIVGAGPIGLSMAQALKDSGLKVTIIEKQPQDAIANPKADGREIAITHRTKKLMQQLNQWQLLDKSKIHYLKKAAVYNGQSMFAMGFEKPEQVNGHPIETLGYLLSNHRIRKAAYDALLADITHPERSNLTFKFDQQIEQVHIDDEYAQVTLADGQPIKGQLLLAADSRVSFMRKALGISADMHDFGRTVLVFRCQHSQSNQLTAHEGFYYGKTLAVLPLGEFESSLVITVDNNKVEQLNSLSKQQLAEEMQSWLKGSLGKITVTSKIHQYPLLGVHANRFYGKRCALIGDAAVGMHPVTAHGYNLGMESVDILSTLLCKAAAQHKDISNPQLLAKYQYKHMPKTKALYHGTNAIVKLYTNESKPAKLARHLGLRLGHSFMPIKKLITNQLTG